MVWSGSSTMHHCNSGAGAGCPPHLCLHAPTTVWTACTRSERVPLWGADQSAADTAATLMSRAVTTAANECGDQSDSSAPHTGDLFTSLKSQVPDGLPGHRRRSRGHVLRSKCSHWQPITAHLHLQSCRPRSAGSSPRSALKHERPRSVHPARWADVPGALLVGKPGELMVQGHLVCGVAKAILHAAAQRIHTTQGRVDGALAAGLQQCRACLCGCPQHAWRSMHPRPCPPPMLHADGSRLSAYLNANADVKKGKAGKHGNLPGAGCLRVGLGVDGGELR